VSLENREDPPYDTQARAAFAARTHILSAPSTPADRTAPGWHAVVIGIDRYPRLPPGKQLSGCVNDADAIRSFLIDRLQVPQGAIHHLTSPRDAATAATVTPATAANIRTAFASVTQPGRLRPGDHVVLYYAGHGAALSRAAADGTKDRHYGLVAEDVAPQTGGGWANMILGAEIYGFLRSVEAQGATATVIADTCHSGASTRAMGDDTDTRERALEIEALSEQQWQEFVEQHPAFHSSATRGADVSTRDMTPLGGYPGGDFVMLTGCLDSETSKEASDEVAGENGPVKIPHGLLTLSLLTELKAIPVERVSGLRWIDFYYRLRNTVAQRAMQLPNSTPQTPALEGRPEKPVFGGTWLPFEPGFTVRTGNGRLTVDGGEVQGLEPGATIVIYPPDATDLSSPTIVGAEALIESATSMTSVAQLVDPSAAILDQSRARLVRPSAAAKPITVRIRTGDRPMPAPIQEALQIEAAARRFFTLVDPSDHTPAHAELRRWTGEVPMGVWPSTASWAGARDGWVVVRRDRFGAPTVDSVDAISPDDIVAYLPDAGPPIDEIAEDRKDVILGDALARGLSAYGRYLRARDRRATDDTLAAMLDVRLRAGQGTAPSRHEEIEALAPLTATDGRYMIGDPPHWLWAEIRIAGRTSLPLDVGWLAFSDDGNILPLWPPPGVRPTFTQGDVVHVGFNRQQPLALSRRPDQRASLWTLKAVACTSVSGGPLLNLSALAQPSVQEEFAAVLGAARTQTRGSVAAALTTPEQPAWYAWDLRVAVSR
jgi:hypothetical protein